MITIDDIRKIYPAVRSIVHRTPIISCSALNQLSGNSDGPFVLKMENLQRTGSFKIRGAYNRLLALGPEQKSLGVVAASAGNHAQGIALAAQLLGIRSKVYMPLFASIAKIQATRGYGAEVVLVGDNFDDAVAAAKSEAAENGSLYVSAYDDDGIITGQGTLGIELLEDIPDLDTVVLSVGGGGLFAGVSTAIHAIRPNARVIGVQSAGAPTAVESWELGHLAPPTHRIDTIADGIAIKSPSARTFEYIKAHADDMVTVSDDEIATAMLLLLERVKAVVEPAGAAGVAALLTGRIRANGKTAVIVSGGNVDLKLLADLIEREMIHAKRYMHFFTAVPDRPGGLVALLEEVARLQGNIISVDHNRISPSVPLGQTGVEILLAVRDAAHIAAVDAGLVSAGYRVELLD